MFLEPVMVTTGVFLKRRAASGVFKNEFTGTEGERYQT